jgi:transitional endoplasmic reticulum ATPase
MSTNREITLIVQEAPVQDKGKDIARISWEAMERLGLTGGDAVEIEGLERTYAVVSPSSSQWADVIFIDGNIRRRAGVGIREQATIRRATPQEARKIVFQIIQDVQGLDIRELEQFLSEQLDNTLLFQGKDIAIPVERTGRDPFEDFFSSRNIPGTMFWNTAPSYVVVRVVATEPERAVIPSQKTKYVVGRSGKQTQKEISRQGSAETGEKEVHLTEGYIPDIHYEDIGGLDRELAQVREMIELPLRNPDLFNHLGIEPPKGVLLYGPPGTGKTLIARAVANEVNAHFINLSGPEIMNKYYGESEGKLREVFEEAQEHAPSVIFIDEIDSIAPKREDTKGEVERRIVAQLLSLMDGLKNRGRVIVIAATNLPDNLDPALRRGGRFDREIEIGIPDVSGRMTIFQIHSQRVPLDLTRIDIIKGLLTRDEHTQRLRIEEDIINLKEKNSSGPSEDRRHDAERRLKSLYEQKEEVENQIRRRLFLQPFANQTHGFVGADISLVVKEAAMHALRKGLEKVSPKDLKEGKIDTGLIASIRVTQEDFQAALSHVEPSAMREVLIEVPDISWGQVGGLDDVKKELREAVEWPLKYPQIFRKLQTNTPKGILLFGPPGTGKTLMAKAIAHESECNFISVKGPELISKWVGESEKGIREVFRKARQAAPSIIFFDEIDSLVPKRGSFSDATHVTESVVSQILTEMDGLEELKNVTIIAATNRPDMLDDALMRPGRLERHIYVPPPEKEGRKNIFNIYLNNPDTLLTQDITIDDLADKTKGFVGADIEALIREAKLAAMREFISLMDGRTSQELEEAVANVRITANHFEEAFERVRPSLDERALERYAQESWQILYNQEQRSILERAADIIRYGKEKDIPDDKIRELRSELFEVARKNFDKISDCAQELDKKYHLTYLGE